MERLTLIARVSPVPDQADSPETARFVARIDALNLQAEGPSPESAQDELVQAMLSWISSHDCAESMAGALTAAGFPEIDDDTELQLEFERFSETAP